MLTRRVALKLGGVVGALCMFLYGTGHGKPGWHERLPVRHARLAVGAATTLASFLFETYAARARETGRPSAEVS